MRLKQHPRLRNTLMHRAVQFKRQWKPVTLIAGAIATIIAIACSPDSTPTKPNATPAARVEQTSASSAQLGITHRSMADLHRRNPMDWVGVAHNRAVDVFATELRAGHIRRGHL